jgi:hypothetical protein
MYLRTCGGFKSAKSLGSRIPNPESTNPQITKNWSSNRKSSSATFAEVYKYNNLFKFANLRVCDLRTALLWKIII